MEKVKVASVQFEHKDGDKTANLKKIEDFVIQASKENVQIIAFPECCITGYWYLKDLTEEQLLELGENLNNSPSCNKLLELSKKYNMTIGAGLVEVDDNNDLYNTYVVTMPDGKMQFHRKIHCFVSRFMKSGDQYTVFDTPHGCKLGVLICYDNNIIENARMTALKGADIMLAPHQTGGCRSEDPNIMGIIDSALWDNRDNDPESIEKEFKGEKGHGWLMRWLPSRAHDNGIFYVFSNGVGKDGDEIRTGNAMIIDTYGRVIADTWKAAEMMVTAELDPSLRGDSTGERWISARRPDLYGPLMQKTDKEVDIWTARFAGKGA